LTCAAPARADGGGASTDSVYLVGEFVDPVCIYQHGMQGALQKQCAMVRGRVEQGIHFLDIRERRLYTVIGQTHWVDPEKEFFDRLGDTVAVAGRAWHRMGSSAIAISAVYPVGDQPRPSYAWWPWAWHASTLVGCGLAALLYLLAMGPWRRRLGGPARFEKARAAAFFSGLALVVVSLNGPIHDLSDLYLFSTHMVQHLLLAEAFPPLLLLGVPGWLWDRMLAPRVAGGTWRLLAGVPMGFALYTVAFSIWHVPQLYNLMMRDHGFHILMHLMVMATATLMWWPILGQGTHARRLAEPAQMLYLFVVGIPMSLVAAMITFAEQPLYDWYALAPRFMGISAVDDQRAGGLIMWVPGAFVYWALMTAVFFRWSAREEKAARPVPQGASSSTR
jgi:putative membrane protein